MPPEGLYSCKPIKGINLFNCTNVYCFILDLHVSFLLIIAVPKVQFRNPSYDVCENDLRVSAMVIRSGDLSIQSTVRCYTRQGSAQVMMDYDERPNTEASIITFLPGRLQKCL